MIDFDRVEEHNIGTQMYGPDDVGDLKVAALERIVHAGSGISISPIAKRVQKPKDIAQFSSLAVENSLVIDAFDNAEARRFAYEFGRDFQRPVLHVGFNGGYSELKFNDHYKVPSGEGEDICEYPLARNMVTLTCSVAAEMIVKYLTDSGPHFDRSVTIRDLRIHTDE